MVPLFSEGDYKVVTRHASSYSWFTIYVLLDGLVVAEKSCCKSYRRAARWAKRKIRDHKKGRDIN